MFLLNLHLQGGTKASGMQFAADIEWTLKITLIKNFGAV